MQPYRFKFKVTHKEFGTSYLHYFNSQLEIGYFMLNNYTEYKMQLI